ncbi:MAG: glutathione S-transferase C-terminal domain-containing protein, partial [Deltaproteobacteria bacterium]|nr:glutathione S-transferase C-terminal domain-containing protein [Deltaproteobacteria bacterium]
GVYAGLVHLGVDEHTEKAWQASQHRLLGRLEAHFSQHDYLLGGTPSLADFGLLGPLYAHLYRDAVSGFALRTHFPLVCEWVERTNGEGALNARMVGQKIYGLDEDGNLVGRTATSDAGQWLPDDEIPETLLPILEVFFEEMWPVLESSAAVLTRYIQSDAHKPGGELPGKTFTATPGFEALQTDEGALTHSFAIGDVTGRRMVIPYQIWMLQRIEPVLAKAVATTSGRESVAALIGRFTRGSELLRLGDLLKGCRVRKEGALLYSV